jgi:hypothetical protein
MERNGVACTHRILLSRQYTYMLKFRLELFDFQIYGKVKLHFFFAMYTSMF